MRPKGADHQSANRVANFVVADYVYECTRHMHLWLWVDEFQLIRAALDLVCAGLRGERFVEATTMSCRLIVRALLPCGRAKGRTHNPIAQDRAGPCARYLFRLVELGSSAQAAITLVSGINGARYAANLNRWVVAPMPRSSAFCTSARDKPNCRAISDGLMPALNAARTASI